MDSRGCPKRVTPFVYLKTKVNLIMTIEQTQIVDMIFVNKNTGELLLVISDHLDWEQDVHPHLMLLQEKLNTYLSFVESGEILEAYPDSKGRNIVITVVGKYPLGEAAIDFFTQAASIIEEAGMKLRFEVLKEA